MRYEELNKVEGRNRITSDRTQKADHVAHLQKEIPRIQQQDIAALILNTKQTFQNHLRGIGTREVDTSAMQPRGLEMADGDRNRPAHPTTSGRHRLSTSTSQRVTGYNASPPSFGPSEPSTPFSPTNVPVGAIPNRGKIPQSSMMGLRVALPDETIGNGPPFAPQRYQQWRIEVKL